VLSPSPRDAYDVHFFEDDFNYGIIASEYKTIYTTTDRGLSWTPIDVTTDGGVDPCPAATGHINGNIEWWGLDFDDPSNPATGAYLAGGAANQRGYIYRTDGIWTHDWVQLTDYEFLQGHTPAECAPSTLYDVLVLDPEASPPRAVGVGYGSQVYDVSSGNPNPHFSQRSAAVAPSRAWLRCWIALHPQRPEQAASGRSRPNALPYTTWRNLATNAVRNAG